MILTLDAIKIVGLLLQVGIAQLKTLIHRINVNRFVETVFFEGMKPVMIRRMTKSVVLMIVYRLIKDIYAIKNQQKHRQYAVKKRE